MGKPTVSSPAQPERPYLSLQRWATPGHRAGLGLPSVPTPTGWARGTRALSRPGTEHFLPR